MFSIDWWLEGAEFSQSLELQFCLMDAGCNRKANGKLASFVRTGCFLGRCSCAKLIGNQYWALWYIHCDFLLEIRDLQCLAGRSHRTSFLHLWAWGVFPKPLGQVPLQTIKRMDLRRRVPRKKQLCHVCLALMGMALLQLGSCLVGANLSQSSSSSRIPAHQMSKVLQTVPTAPSFSFPPEPTVGKIEYKLRLTAEEGSERFEELVTQLNWRMRECTSEEECAEFDDLSQYRDAIYRLGVSDDGQVPGLSDAELVESLSVLKAMAARIPATVTIISRKAGIHPGNRSAITALVRASQSSLFVLGGGDEIRICTVGNVDSGKSTLLGLLTQGVQDDGRGRARSAGCFGIVMRWRQVELHALRQQPWALIKQGRWWTTRRD